MIHHYQQENLLHLDFLLVGQNFLYYQHQLKMNFYLIQNLIHHLLPVELRLFL
tara:strand:- start:194 stop:352 length:159 start_codon:yes stop_codon:yes gene_type:complete